MVGTVELALSWAALMALTISVFGILDAWKTLVALNASDRAWDINARVLAKGGIRTACIRTVQMFGMVASAHVAHAIDPRPAVSSQLATVWTLLLVICLLSAIKEVLAMWDRRHIVPEEDEARA